MREVDMYLSGTKGPRVGIGKCERTGCDGKARSRIPAGTSWNSARPLSRRIPCGPRVLRSAPHPLSHPLSSPEYSVQSCTGSDLRRRHDLLCLSLSAPPSSPTERASVVTTPQPSSITRPSTHAQEQARAVSAYFLLACLLGPRRRCSRPRPVLPTEPIPSVVL